MTDVQDALAQIKARAEKATEGPWAALERRGGLEYDIHNGDDDHPHGEMWHREDAEFIAHARTDVPRLVAAMEAVQEAIEKYPVPHKRDDPTAEIASAIEGFGDAVLEVLADKLTGEDDE